MSSPIITQTIADTRREIGRAKRQGKTIGLVPTMGALHVGHASLIDASRAETDYVAVSVFVNPMQFGPDEDFHRYPRPFADDVKLCGEHGVGLIFHPESNELYPQGFRSFVEVSELAEVLCGASRPGHFRGVATVVLKLFNIVQPEVAFFGQKDAQQVAILERMVRDLDVPVRLRVCPIMREADGLAMSSRNRYLTAEQRRHSTVLYRTLEMVKEGIERGARDAVALRNDARAMIEDTPGARLDYFDLVDASTLRPLERLAGDVLIAVAVYFGTTRLIDNLRLSPA